MRGRETEQPAMWLLHAYEALYIMDNGTVSTQPAPNQLVQIIDVFKEKGITVHIDMGSYEGPDDTDVLPGHEIGDYGGGNSIGYLNSLDFYNASALVPDLLKYKIGDATLNIQPQFNSSNRYGIWRYIMMTTLIEASTTLGKANVSDDEALVSYGSVYSNSLSASELNIFLPKVIAHELGHGLCLTPGLNGISGPTYPGHYAGCTYSKVDGARPGISDYWYNSIMHYSRLSNSNVPLGEVDYSEGQFVLTGEDNDDWNAIMNSVKDFSIRDKLYVYYLAGAPCALECF